MAQEQLKSLSLDGPVALAGNDPAITEDNT